MPWAAYGVSPRRISRAQGHHRDALPENPQPGRGFPRQVDDAPPRRQPSVIVTITDRPVACTVTTHPGAERQPGMRGGHLMLVEAYSAGGSLALIPIAVERGRALLAAEVGVVRPLLRTRRPWLHVTKTRTMRLDGQHSAGSAIISPYSAMGCASSRRYRSLQFVVTTGSLLTVVRQNSENPAAPTGRWLQ